MKIISGKLKGKNIPINNKANFRPTLSRIREDLFNILAHNSILKINWSQSIFCDLFCGSGSVGLEALSRGCSKVIFNDLDKMNLNHIDNFLKNNEELKYELWNVDCYKGDIAFLKNCNVIFIDPPYKDDYKLIDQIIFDKIKNTSLIIFESEKKFESDDIILIKRYKNKSLFFIKKS